MDKSSLKKLIADALVSQGFRQDGNDAPLQPPVLVSKDEIRRFHALSVKHKRENALPALRRQEARMLGHFADPHSLDIDLIDPHLIEVQPGSSDEVLFRYACLHWSIPVSSGYGRRLRFLVKDAQNDKLIGLIGLGDPVFSLAPRDNYIGWSVTDRRERLRHVMDAFVLGAVPPYSDLLCGKLVAMLVGSEQVQDAFIRKYGGRISLISQKSSPHPLVMVTTMSALGRSSIYNRIRLAGEKLFVPVGYSAGFGDFHFANSVYKAMFDFVAAQAPWTAKHLNWGKGSRNKREVVLKCLSLLDMRPNLLQHGIRRQAYVVPLALNASAFLRGEVSAPLMKTYSTSSIFMEFKDRWWTEARLKSLRRASFQVADLCLWPSSEGIDHAKG